MDNFVNIFKAIPEASFVDISYGVGVHAMQVANDKINVLAVKLKMKEARNLAKSISLNHAQKFAKIFIAQSLKMDRFPLNSLETEVQSKRLILLVDTGPLSICKVFDESDIFLKSQKFEIDMIIISIASFPPQNGKCLHRTHQIITDAGFIIAHPLSLEDLEAEIFGDMHLWNDVKHHLAFLKHH